MSGWAEIVKHAAVLDREYFQMLEGMADVLQVNTVSLQEIIGRSLELKSRVVQEDGQEAGWRKVLNFGHTAGHAIESLAHLRGQEILHGEAVAWGMYIESKLAVRKEMLADEQAQRLHALLQGMQLLKPLPFAVPAEDLLGALLFDKKRAFDQQQWTLLSDLGSGAIDVSCDTALVREALEHCLGS